MNIYAVIGGVKSVKIPKYKGTDTGKGFALVEFKTTISHRVSYACIDLFLINFLFFLYNNTNSWRLSAVFCLGLINEGTFSKH